jgi:uncharacterized protein DUF4406
MRVFISGPITKGDHNNHAKIEAARKVFNKAEDDLKRRGHEVVNPFKLIPDGTKLTWAYCMRINLHALLDCDGIHMLPEWHESEGARLEHTVASKLNLVMVK